jgi:hypothetical protein
MNEEYLRQLYDYMVAEDETYSTDVTFESFVENMGQQQFAAQIYEYMGSMDPSYKSEVSVIDFLQAVGTVKKKDDGESPSEDTSSESVKVDDFSYLETIDPNNLQGRDTRAAGYVDPSSLALRKLNQEFSGNYSEKGPEQMIKQRMIEQDPLYQNALLQRDADIAYTKEQRAAAQGDLDVMTAEEDEIKQELFKKERQENLEINQSPTFQNDLASITSDVIATDNEDESAKYLSGLLGKYGFTVRQSGGKLKKFFSYIGGVPQEDIDKEFDGIEVSINTEDGVKTEYIDLDAFTDSGDESEAEKLRNFVGKYAQTPLEQRELVDSDYMQNVVRAQNLRSTPRILNGEESTVLFQSANIDGNEVVYPTLFPINPNIQTNDPDYWVELDGMEAYEEAKKRGEVFSGFADREQAELFAKGSWKEINNVEVEADRFFKDRGQDYLAIKEQFTEYERVRDKIDFIEAARSGSDTRARELKFLTDEEKKLYSDLYGSDGFLRNDILDVLDEEKKVEADLSPIYTDDQIQDIREDFDVYIDKKYQKIAQESVRQNMSSKYVQNELLTKSLSEFGVNIEELPNYTPENAEGVALKDAILTSYKATKEVQQAAADTYQVAETYLDSKFDKNLRGEIVENWSGMTNEIKQGWFRGKAGNEILKLALGLKDIDDDASTTDIAQAIVDYMEAGNTGKTSRAMARWHSSRGFREAWDAFSDNPAELAISFAGNSISQMLPYGWKIIGGTSATGLAVGAGVGATGFVTGPGGVLTTGAGALTGLSWGLRTGFAATGYALEYTNAVMDAAKEYDYDIMDPEQMKAALQDERVWAFGAKRGAQRGIPIAIVDILSAGLAGRVFQVGKTASFGRRTAISLGERVVFDPLAEATGEYMAQVSAGEKIDWKEIFAEGLGGLGNNAPFAALNMALDMRANNNVAIANDLSTIQGLNKELKNKLSVSPKRVSNWANNMERLGQISKEQNQRIQLNLGLRQDALNVLNATEGKVTPEVLNRTMELMAAKNELEATQNRKAVFGNKISEVKIELAELAETKKLRPTDKQTNLNIGGISTPQQSSTDIRSDVSATYKIDGENLSRKQLIDKISKMTLDTFNDSNVQVENDQEVTDIINNKFKQDAVQERKAETVDENQQAGNVQKVDEELSSEQTTGPKTTTTTTGEEVDVEEEVDVDKKESIESEKKDLEQVLKEEGIEEPAKKKKGAPKKKKVSLKTPTKVGGLPKTFNAQANVRETEEELKGKEQGIIEERDAKVEDLNNEITLVKQQLKKDLAKKGLTKEDKTNLREEAKSEINSYKEDIKETKREATKQVRQLKKQAKPKRAPSKAKIAAEIKKIDAEIKKVRASKRNRPTKAALIKELNQKKKNIQEGKVDFRTKEAGATVNVAPFFDTSVESTTEASGVRTSNEYQQYKQSLIDLAKDLGLEIEIEEAIGGYVNDAGTKIREISTVVKLKDATLEQASEFAAIAAALAPEVQESSIAAEYTTDGAINHNGDEITIKVSDTEGTFQALQEAGIDEFTLSETNNSLTLLDIFAFSDPQRIEKLDKLLDLLNEKNISYEVSDKKAINSRYIGKESRKQILSDGRQGSLQQQQEGSSLRDKILLAINRDAENEGVTTEEYTQVEDTDTNMNTNDLIDKYVGMDDVGKFLQFLNKSFPFVQFSVNQETFNKMLASPDVTPYIKNGQVIYGMTKDGKIFINPEVHKSKSDLFNTAIHEMGHVWIENLKLQGKEIYNKGAALIKQTALYRRNLKKFDGDVTKAVDETMATLIGNKGETVVNESLKGKIKNWLDSVWTFVKNTFKLSKDLSPQEIQDLTLDEFLGTAVADILSGKPVKIDDKQLNTLTENLAETMFRTDDTVSEIVRIGRENAFSDASIREVLKGRGFSAAIINEAMTYDVDGTTSMPTEFSRVEGGILKAAKLFNEVNQKLQDFSMKAGKRIKTFSEIRQKAQELLKANPIFQEQTKQVQQELQIGFDRSLGYRGNPEVQQEISNIRANLKQQNVGATNLNNLKIQLKNFIRASLPPSKKYSQAKINRLIASVTNLKKPEQFRAAQEKVMKVVDEQRAIIKRDTLAEIYKIVKDKSSFKLQSKKRRLKGVDGIAQVTFANIKEVLDAVLIRDPELRAEAVRKISDYLLKNEQKIFEASQKVVRNEELDYFEQNLLQLQLAYDQFIDLPEASLEQAQVILEDLKQQKKEGILRFNERRLKKAAEAEARAEEVTNQIKETNNELFNEDGSLKDEQQIRQDLDDIKSRFVGKGIIGKVFNKILSSFNKNPFKEPVTNLLTNMETVTSFLDNKAKGLTSFTDKVYRRLNRASEVVLQNQRKMRQKLEDFATEVGFKSYYDFESKVNKALGIDNFGRPKTKTIVINKLDKSGNITDVKINITQNANQLLRIYALSKNETQRNKLLRQGITPEILEEIKQDLGPEIIAFADKIVDYFSTEYFNETNNVYKQANGINLGFVENYFPTKTIKQKVDASMLLDGNFNGIFSSETAPAFKERTDTRSGIDLKTGGFINVMQNHIETMERYKGLAIPVQQLNEFFNIPAVDLLLDVSGMKKLLKVTVNAAVNPQSAAANSETGGGKFISALANKFTGFALAFKLIQIAKQATSFVNAFSQYNYFKPDSKVPKVLQGPIEVAMFAVDAVGVLISMVPDFVGKEGAIAKARKMSATFDQRITEGLEGDVYGLETGSQTLKQVGKGSGVFPKLVRNFKRASGSPTIIGDILGVMGYYINYKRNIANGMSEAQALEAFNDYNSTQQSRRATDKIPLQLKGDGLSRFFTMFGSTLFLQMNKVRQSVDNLSKSYQLGKVEGNNKVTKTVYGAKAVLENKQAVRSLYLNFAVANVFFTAVSNIALLTRGDDEDRDVFFDKLKKAMMGLNLIYQIPIVGATVEQGINYFSDDTRKPVDDIVNPLTSVLMKAIRQFEEATENGGSLGEQFAKGVEPLIELALGAQTDPFVGLFNAIKGGVFGDVNEEEFYEAIYDFLGITPSYRPGYGQKGSSVEGIIPQGGIKTKSDLKRYDPELYEMKYGEKDRIRKEQREQRKQMLEDMGYKEINGKLYPID